MLYFINLKMGIKITHLKVCRNFYYTTSLNKVTDIQLKFTSNNSTHVTNNISFQMIKFTISYFNVKIKGF